MFHSILRFSRNEVFGGKIAESPSFLRHTTSDRAEIFSQILDAVWDADFFRFKNIALVISGRFYKLALIEKQAFFMVYLVFLTFLFKEKKIKRNQHPKQCLVSVKKFSARSDVVSQGNADQT